jgi:prepilin-type N-terminal cleavage/methylation domain-containing protein
MTLSIKELLSLPGIPTRKKTRYKSPGKCRGFTLMELVMTIIILGIIGTLTGVILIFVIQYHYYIPSKLTTDSISSDIARIVIEGDDQAKGLRFTKQIPLGGFPTGIYLGFYNRDDDYVEFLVYDEKLYRRINSGSWHIIPYYLSGEYGFMGDTIQIWWFEFEKFFWYYNSDGKHLYLPLAHPQDVAYIEIRGMARGGSGEFSDWEGKSEIISGININQN